MDVITTTVLIMGGLVFLVSLISCIWNEILKTMDAVVGQAGISLSS